MLCGQDFPCDLNTSKCENNQCVPDPTKIDTDGDGLKDAVDQCPAQGGANLDEHGCPIPPLKVSFLTSNNDPERTKELHSKALGIVRVKWTIQGGGVLQEAYLYGPFNRRHDDADGGHNNHYLVVRDPDTIDNWNQVEIDQQLGESSEAYKHYLTGDLCQSDANCYEYSKRFPSRPGVPIVRINLMPLLTDAHKSGQGWQHFFHTRVHVRNTRFVIVARSQTGQWAVEEFETKAPEVGEPAINVKFNETGARLEGDFTKVVGKPAIAGCEPGSDEVSLKGEYHYAGDCVFNKENKTIFIWAQGVGLSNHVMRKYRLFCESPSRSLEAQMYYPDAGGSVSVNYGPEWVFYHYDEGKMKLQGLVSRQCHLYEVKDDGSQEAIEDKVTSWVKEPKLSAYYGDSNCDQSSGDIVDSSQALSDNNTAQYKIGNSLAVEARLDRNKKCYSYEFSVKNMNGTKFSTTKTVNQQNNSFPYHAAKLEVAAHWTSSWHYNCTVMPWCDSCDDCDSEYVWSCRDHTITMVVQLKASYLVSITPEGCSGTVDHQPDKMNANETITYTGTNSDNSISCTFKAKTYDGKTITTPVVTESFSNNC